jgi:hypothetical protein
MDLVQKVTTTAFRYTPETNPEDELPDSAISALFIDFLSRVTNAKAVEDAFFSAFPAFVPNYVALKLAADVATMSAEYKVVWREKLVAGERRMVRKDADAGNDYTVVEVLVKPLELLSAAFRAEIITLAPPRE